MQLEYPVPPGTRCCDNCHPDLFPVETVKLTGDTKARAGRQPKKSSDELEEAVRERLMSLRKSFIERDYPNQYIVTGKALMPATIIEALSIRARSFISVDVLVKKLPYWCWAPKYGVEVVAAIQEVLTQFPDHEQDAKDAAAQERKFQALQTLANKDLRRKLTLIFDDCYDTVHQSMKTVTVKGRGKDAYREETVRRCQLFLYLPRRTVGYSFYPLFAIC